MPIKAKREPPVMMILLRLYVMHACIAFKMTGVGQSLYPFQAMCEVSLLFISVNFVNLSPSLFHQNIIHFDIRPFD